MCFVQSAAVVLVLNQKWLAASEISAVTKHQPPPASARRPLSKYSNIYQCVHACIGVYIYIVYYVYCIHIYTHIHEYK